MGNVSLRIRFCAVRNGFGVVSRHGPFMFLLFSSLHPAEPSSGTTLSITLMVSCVSRQIGIPGGS